jgi:hypothetical protein
VSHGVADNNAEESGTYDAEDASNRGSNQPLQADLAQPDFEQDDSHPEQEPNHRIHRTTKPKGLEIIGNRNDN